MNPCLVARERTTGRWFAWNEDGRLIAFAETFADLALRLTATGYEQISPNSRLAATIRDKWREKGYRVDD